MFPRTSEASSIAQTGARQGRDGHRSRSDRKASARSRRYAGDIRRAGTGARPQARRHSCRFHHRRYPRRVGPGVSDVVARASTMRWCQLSPASTVETPIGVHVLAALGSEWGNPSRWRSASGRAKQAATARSVEAKRTRHYQTIRRVFSPDINRRVQRIVWAKTKPGENLRREERALLGHHNVAVCEAGIGHRDKLSIDLDGARSQLVLAPLTTRFISPSATRV